MSQKDQLKDFKEIKLVVEKQFERILGDTSEFPKYTTQLINIANQNAQGTRPEVVGQMSDLIHQCPEKSYDGWKKWYLETHPDAIDTATDKVYSMILNMKDAMEIIDKDMVREWVYDLVINKTAEGLIIQEIILKHIAELKGKTWRFATPDEESRNIDGIIGDVPVSIKPETYLAKKSSLREDITIEMIYYKKTAKYLTIYTNLI
jgi:hypothetical protein